MEQVSKAELEEIFVDIKKAYRLLYFYQRRILDTVKFISDTLSKNVVSGYSLFSNNPPRNGSSINLDSWAWDWLNMYAYEFLFQKETIDANDYSFAIAVQSDTAFYSREGIKKTSVELFPDVEETSTKLYFYLARNTWKPKEFESAWSKNADDEFKWQEEGKFFISKRFDLSDFRDEDSIIGKLKEVKCYFENNGVANFLTI